MLSIRKSNVTGGSRYLRELLERYNFDLVKALAAYNAGPERVEQYRGVPPFRETRAYVARIVHEYNQRRSRRKNGESRRGNRPQAKAKLQLPSDPLGSAAKLQPHRRRARR